MNKIEISGRITKEPVFSHENHGEKFYSTQITSVRTSGVPDTLNVTFSEIFLKNIKEDEQVKIFGEIRTMNYDGHCHIFVFAKDVAEYPGKDGNFAELDGYICREPIFRETPLNRKITDLLVASNRQYGKSDYIPCAAWGRKAVKAGFMNVGEKISCTGRLQSREYLKRYEDGTEENKTAYELSINNLREGDSENGED